MTKTIILASGGTGGHIFPAEALAGELVLRGYNPILITDRRYENYSSGNKDFEVYTIRAGSISGNFGKRISGIADLGIGYFQASKLLKQLKPLAVVGFGGYPSFPTVQSAIRRNIKTIIHEQNSMLGRANFVLSSKVDAIATSFSEVSGVRDDDIDKVTLTGNPVRESIKTLRNMEYPEVLNEGNLRILVTGGSQGASVFSDVIPKAISLLPDEFKRRIRIDQQCRKSDVAETRELYQNIGVSADLALFFSDIPARLASAHIIIARSGASTLAELTTVGRPVIMVPYPHAKDDHQTVNANALEDRGGGWVMPEEAFTPEAVASRLESFLNLPSTLKEAAKNSKSAGIPEAAENLADLVERICT